MDVSSQLNIFHNFVDQVSSSGPPFTPNINTSNITVGQRSGNFGIVINEYDLTNTLKQIKINSQEFSNGVQTLPYVQMYEKINAVNACVYPPPDSTTLQVNNKIDVVGTTTTEIIIQADTTPTIPVNIVATDNATYSSGLAIDKLFSANISAYPTLITTEIKPEKILLDNQTGNIQLELTNDISLTPEPTIRFQNSSGLNNYINFSGINADGHYNFNLNNNERFFKQNNPFSFSVYTANDGDYIEKNYPFVLADNISVLKLYNPANYLDDNGNPGWSCLISNLSGSDILIDTAGYQFYSHANGLQGGPIIFNKWSTGRITLVYSSSTVGDYIWAASLF